ncbi:hypothetical protein B0H16DRAFT_1881017 [Mycena metata]|uniref:Uncharacterized protein n=1 Tax=Mycena metata TaxID=1033252 RepID=A0AAD7JV21_9AGAR|nr:hypothetical protein B0H16DRAFT_1881017 [Mycena metata]
MPHHSTSGAVMHTLVASPLWGGDIRLALNATFNNNSRNPTSNMNPKFFILAVTLYLSTLIQGHVIMDVGECFGVILIQTLTHAWIPLAHTKPVALDVNGKQGLHRRQ